MSPGKNMPWGFGKRVKLVLKINVSIPGHPLITYPLMKELLRGFWQIRFIYRNLGDFGII